MHGCASELAVGDRHSRCVCRNGHLAQKFGTDLMTETARAAMHADDNASFAQPEPGRRRMIVSSDDLLDLEIVVARTQRTHRVALPALRGFGNRGVIGADHSPALLDTRETFALAIALLVAPACAPAKHRVHLLPRALQPARGPHPPRDAAERPP